MLSKLKKWCLIVCVGAIALYGVFWCVTVYLSIEKDYWFLKRDLDNPYIDSDYEDWHWVDVDNFGKCLFPAQWNLKENAGALQITDEEGDLIAMATVITTDKTAVRTSILSEILEYPVTEISTTYIPEFTSVKASFLGTLDVAEGIDKTCGIFKLHTNENSGSSELFVVFPEFDKLDSSELADITEAISYSYSFPEQCKKKS